MWPSVYLQLDNEDVEVVDQPAQMSLLYKAGVIFTIEIPFWYYKKFSEIDRQSKQKFVFFLVSEI